MIHKEAIPLIISDVVMPEMAAVRRRSREEPRVLLSGDASAVCFWICRGAGGAATDRGGSGAAAETVSRMDLLKKVDEMLHGAAGTRAVGARCFRREKEFTTDKRSGCG